MCVRGRGVFILGGANKAYKIDRNENTFMDVGLRLTRHGQKRRLENWRTRLQSAEAQICISGAGR